MLHPQYTTKKRKSKTFLYPHILQNFSFACGACSSGSYIWVHSCLYPFVVIYNRPNWQAWLTSVWISYTQQHEWGKVASWETAGTLVHYHYHHDDWCRWWDSQQSHPWALQPFIQRGAANWYEQSLFLSPCAVPLSLLPHRTPKVSRWMMCSRHQHESKPSHHSGPLLQTAVAG